MDRLRRILQKSLPEAWWNRIDLENASIRDCVRETALRTGQGERVLDAGAGQCRYRDYFSHARYTGVDFAEGEASWDYTGLDTVARLERLPFGDEVFDVIICTQVLEHLPEPRKALQELFRVTRPGGRMMLTAPLGFGEHQVPHDYYRFTRYGLRFLLETSGWSVQRIEPRGGYFRYMAVMLMWMYIYLFPESRPSWVKWILAPLQVLAAFVFIIVGAPLVQLLDGLDREQVITLGYVADCIRPAEVAPSTENFEIQHEET